jgi:hypothetical protein
VSRNRSAGVRIFEAPGAAAQSTIDGLVAWGDTTNLTPVGYGLFVSAGSKLKVRRSVFLGNLLNGVTVSSKDGTVAGNDVSQIDLGTAADPGLNTLQVSQSQQGRAADATGLCVSLQQAPTGNAGTLRAEGNLFSDDVNCSLVATPPAMIVRGGCSGFNDLGTALPVGVTVTVDVANCD